MRKFGRKDANHNPLVKFAEAFGASVLDLSPVGDGCPDILLGLHGKTFLVEFKTLAGALTPDQQTFIATWCGSPVHVIRTEAELERLLRTVVPNHRVPRKAQIISSAVPQP